MVAFGIVLRTRKIIHESIYIFQLALSNLRLNKFRSILAIFGITIGIIAIATTGMSGAILENSQFQSMNEIGESIYLQVNYTSGTSMRSPPTTMA